MSRGAVFISQSRTISLMFMIFFLSLAGCGNGNDNDNSSYIGNPRLMGISYTSWMSRIDGDKLLSQINIPGTHESGTMHNSCGFDEGKDQDMMPIDQLRSGARILDLRLHYHHSATIGGKDVFRIRHGICMCYTSSSHLTELNLDYVLDDCVNFLDAYPTETIILLIQQASKSHETKDFTKLIESDRYLNNSRYKDRIYLGESIPKLDEVRGKMVWVRRYPIYNEQGNIIDKAEGINLQDWTDQNSYFTYGTINGIKVKIQDAYNYLTREWQSKWAIFDEAALDSVANPEYLVLNLSSAVGGLTSIGPHPIGMAEKINPLLTASYFVSGSNYDWIIMDFMTATLARNVYQSNPEFSQL